MPEIENNNPFAAPTADDTSFARPAPISNYFYAAVLFVLGTASAAMVMLGVSVVVHAVIEIPTWLLLSLVGIGALLFGWYSGQRMFRRLQDLHERKVQLEREQIERLGEFHIW